MKQKRKDNGNKVKAIFLFVLALIIGITLIVYALNTGNFGYSAVLVIIAAILVLFFGFFALRRYKDAVRGMPFEDERSRRVMEKATSKAFYVTLYLLLLVGWLSEDIIKFRDVSQATGMIVGIMALLFFGFWVYYENKN